jgi:hypothetical protein
MLLYVTVYYLGASLKPAISLGFLSERQRPTVNNNRGENFKSRRMSRDIVTCFVVTKQPVSWDMKSTIVYAVTCTSYWVGEKQPSGVGLLADHIGRRTQIRRISSDAEDITKKPPVLSSSQ